jgi:hypothetical protein
MAPTFALAAVRLSTALPTTGTSRLSLGALAVAVWVGLCAAGSIWVQNQAPVLVALRGGGSGAVATAPSAIPAPQPAAGPTAAPGSQLETPSASYVVDLPRELEISSGMPLDVTVTNTGREAWPVDGPSPVHVAARFIAQRTGLHKQVKGLMKESQTVELPGEVAPGGSATVRLWLLAPPIPGRYTLLVHVTRNGVPDPKTNVERVVRIVD